MATYDVEIRFGGDMERAGETVTIPVDDDEYILAAARAADVWLLADCQTGWCTTCAGRLIEGEVDQSNAKRYFEEDEEEGFILPCTARPRSDLVIEVGVQNALLEHRAAENLPPGKAKLDSE
jgi:ferredoxin